MAQLSMSASLTVGARLLSWFAAHQTLVGLSLPPPEAAWQYL